MNISEDLKLYLQERRRALLIEIAGIESLMGIDERKPTRKERRADLFAGYTVPDQTHLTQEAIRRG